VKRVSTASAQARVRSYEDAAALRAALRRFDRRSEDIARANGLTMRGYLLLLMIKTSRGLSEAATPDELEGRLQLAKSTVAELLQRVEEQGLVRRELHPARRGGIVVRLTTTGRRRLDRVFDALGAEREHLLWLLDESPEA
jgi:DNA-binding MarR family transcriptional regulator